jgi:hypothetical protein
MRGIVVAKMIGLLLLGLYLAVGFARPTGGQDHVRFSPNQYRPGSPIGSTP